LLTAFVEHQVIFLGYSLSDPHVINIIYSIAACLTDEHMSKLKNRLVFVEWDGGFASPVVDESFITVAGRTPLPIVRVRTASFVPIFEELASRRRTYPAHSLRLLKENVYDIVQSSTPTERLFVADIDDADPAAPFEVVFGVGVRKIMSEVGYVGITAKDLFEDLLNEGSRYDAGRIVSEVLPSLLSRNRKYLPVFKYLSRASLPACEAESGWESLPDEVKDSTSRVEDLFTAGVGAYNSENIQGCASFADFVEARDVRDVLTYGHLLGRNKMDPSSVRDFLCQVQPNLDTYNSVLRTGFRRLACIYDLLHYGPRQEC
jgi:hypothetical protein